MLIVVILLALAVVMYLLAPKKEPPPITNHPQGDTPRGDTQPPTISAKPTKPSTPLANTRFSGALIEPIDKRITKTLAVKMYLQVIRQARPGRPEKMHKSSAAYFAENVSLHWSMLEQEIPTWELDDMQQNIEGLESDLLDELEVEEGEAPDRERIDWLRKKIKLRREELVELKDRAKKYKNRDLRFFLASELNSFVHGVEPDTFETIAQQTHDFWCNKSKKSTTSMTDG